MNEIDIISVIKKDNLDSKNYFKSIIDEACKNQMLSHKEMSDIQIELLSLLDKRVYRYNGLESSSIRKEILEDISNSNIFTIGVYLKTFRNPDDAIKSIVNDGIENAYLKGRKRIDRILDIIRVYYIKVKQNDTNIENEIYKGTIIGGIKGFLKIYNPDFKAQDMRITADYPLYNNITGKLEGVEFIEEYLKSIYLENSFCKIFSEDKLKYFLHTYAENYKSLVINIFKIVIVQVVGCILAKEDYNNLNISKSGLQNIYDMFENKSKEEIYNLIYETIREINLENTDLIDYINQGIEDVQAEIYNSYKLNNLDKIFITQRFIV